MLSKTRAQSSPRVALEVPWAVARGVKASYSDEGRLDHGIAPSSSTVAVAD